MLEGKKGGVSVLIAPTNAVGDVAVSLSFDLAVDGCALARLNGGCDCHSKCFPQGSEEAAVCFALFAAVEQTLCGDPLAVKKTKVGSVHCGAHNGSFFMNWKVKGNVSSVRKSLGMALHVLNPEKMFSAYQRYVRILGGSPDRDTFNHVADEVAKAAKNVQVVVVGNIKATKEKLDQMLDVISKKHDVQSVSGSKKKPSGHVPCDHNLHTELKSAGWATAVLSDYIQYRVRGLIPLVCNKTLLLPVKPTQWDTIAKKIKKGVKDYANAKYGKVGEALPAIFSYLAVSSAQLGAADVKSALSSKMSADSIADAISKHL